MITESLKVNRTETPVIPDKQTFYRKGCDDGFDHKAICLFASSGFFLGEDTYYKNLKTLQPSTEYEFSEDGRLVSERKLWKWHYAPREISLDEATEEFAKLFEEVTAKQIGGRKVILPLSGGLDSRTQAAVLDRNYSVKSYSYKFARSFDETKYGRLISEAGGFPFSEYVIPEGYLWDCIDELAGINGCYADFTHPRQMAHIREISSLGEVFFLGHWGDVLFDDMKVEASIPHEVQANELEKKIVKRGGRELASAMWKAWGLEGNFDEYLRGRISELLSGIDIENANARIRAFKSMYWAPRWTSANMNVFSHFKPVALPYYSDEICRFICTVPEKHLAARQIQINYIKKKSPVLARIPWQGYDPLNLYNYDKLNSLFMLPSRAYKKLKSLAGGKQVKRNWEIQFLGEENDKQLRRRLFENPGFAAFIPQDLVKEFYSRFRERDNLRYSHPVSMLLTLSMSAK